MDARTLEGVYQDYVKAIDMIIAPENTMAELCQFLEDHPDVIQPLHQSLGVVTRLDEEDSYRYRRAIINAAELCGRSLDDLKDEGENTPAHWSAYAGNLIDIQVLDDLKPSINSPNNVGTTPFFDAIGGNQVGVMCYIKSHVMEKEGVDVTQQTNDYDFNAAMWAVLRHAGEALDYLHKCNPELINQPNKQGYTALDIADWKLCWTTAYLAEENVRRSFVKSVESKELMDAEILKKIAPIGSLQECRAMCEKVESMGGQHSEQYMRWKNARGDNPTGYDLSNAPFVRVLETKYVGELLAEKTNTSRVGL